MADKYIYSFGGGAAKFDLPEFKKTLGNKGANLCIMANAGIPVPPGFVISTLACLSYYERSDFLEDLSKEIDTSIKNLEKRTGKKFGDPENPLTVSVRSGASVSMPGMMDTVLNIGLNDDIIDSWAESNGNRRFVLDSYRRLLNMFGTVVLGLDHHSFESVLSEVKKSYSVDTDQELPLEGLEEVVQGYKAIIKQESGSEFPQDIRTQLLLSIEAVFKSWNNKRAVAYRQMNHIPHNLGTGVTVQSMVFGNKDILSASGVAFTRNPATGEKVAYGEFLMNAQGEDVVAGIRTPAPINKSEGEGSLEEKMPEAYTSLLQTFEKLESLYKDMQDVEFTVESGNFYMLQTRTGKRTAQAALKIAVDLESESILTKDEALLQVDAQSLDQVLHPVIDTSRRLTPVGEAIAASPGAACGRVVFSAEEAIDYHARGEKVILVRHETSADDIHGMRVSEGIITARGGATSHAAVVARGMGIPAVVGAEWVEIDYEAKLFKTPSYNCQEGDLVSLDGSSGIVYLGEVPLLKPKVDENFETIMEWADERRLLKVYANAETVSDLETALELGAEGVGLARTEHMFFEEEKISLFQKMILADRPEDRQQALQELQALHQKDFQDLMRQMDGKTLTIRLLDPPLHEFLPNTPESITKLARELLYPVDFIERKVEALKEANPMLGHRGCRLGVTHPEIYKMQLEAIFNAHLEVGKDACSLDIMVPLVATVKELTLIKTQLEEVLSTLDHLPEHRLGIMIELPQAALIAEDLAKHADFFSFGTNDLTQMTLGLSRDDFATFRAPYQDLDIYSKDPFTSLHVQGVGDLILRAIKEGRKASKKLGLGICGEHGGDPESIHFFHNAKLDYVSCTAYRIPTARLAAAQAAIKK